MNSIDVGRDAVEEATFRSAVREYLQRVAAERNESWQDSGALDETVDAVVGMDEDLRAYVRGFLDDPNRIGTDLRCELASVSDLVAAGETPVHAALFLQWFRRDPMSAAQCCVHHDGVFNIPKMDM